MNGFKNMVRTISVVYAIDVDIMASPLGDIVYYEVLGQGYLALGSLTRTRDLLEKKSNIYSSRPAFTMLREL